MADVHQYGVFPLRDLGFFQLEPPHGFKCGIEALAYVFVGRIGELVDNTHNGAVACEALSEDVLYGNVTREATWTLYLYPIVEDADVHVVSNAVIAVQHSIRNDLVQRFLGVGDPLQSLRAKGIDRFDDLDGLRYSRLDLIVETAIDSDGVEGESLASTLLSTGLVAIDLDRASLGQEDLWFLREQQHARDSRLIADNQLLLSKPGLGLCARNDVREESQHGEGV